ncbi:MAG: hypothetical protein EAY70_14270 [Sphingomonadales bacterium]|nr:MAG: hypothetical protein EAY70_14270 [Sphingomonadales bacterium]
MAFGAPPEVAIAGGAATAGLNAGKNYYDPKLKAAIYDNALDAVICIKIEANSLDPKSLAAISSLQTGGAEGRKLIGDGITLTADKRFFSLVQANLFSVERVLAQRLSNVGSFDPAGVIAEIKTLTEETRQRSESSGATAQNEANSLVVDGSKLSASDDAKAAATVSDRTKIAQTIVQLDTLQSRLQQCVVRAKI